MTYIRSSGITQGIPTNVGRERPPGPKGLPFLGVVLDVAKDQLGFFTNTAAKYGDIVAVNFAGWPTLLVSDMGAIEKVLVKDHRNFIKHNVFWRHVPALFGEGILTSNGELWQRQRRLASPPFAGQQLLAYDKDIVALTERMLGSWKSGQVKDIHPEMMALTLRIAAKAFFESEVEHEIADMDDALNDLTVEVAKRFTRPFVIQMRCPYPDT